MMAYTSYLCYDIKETKICCNAPKDTAYATYVIR